MTDSTRRAQYGEFASPEEQARARGTEPETTIPKSVAATPLTSATSASTPPLQPAAPSSGSKTARSADRFATIALLTFGFISVVTGIPGYLSMADTLQLAYDQMGLGTYSNASLAASLGVAAVIMQVTLWVLTLAVSVRRLKRGRLAWWIPVVGGAVAVMVLLFIVTVAITGDPTFAASLRG